MTVALHFFTETLSRARRYLRAGESRLALDLLRRFTAYPDAPTALLVRAHRWMGMVWLRRRQFRRARRQFCLALKHRPHSARLHYLVACTWHRDSAMNSEQAAAHYEESLRLRPHHPRCLAAYGQLALDCGQVDLGLERLRTAVDLAPDDDSISERFVRALMHTGFPDEATRTTREARFRRPRSVPLQQLWCDLQFQRLRRDKELAALDASRDESPVLLPFVRVLQQLDDNERIIREDEAETLPGPHLVRLSVRRMRRRAP